MIFRVIILFILCFSSTIFAQQLETQIETLEQEYSILRQERIHAVHETIDECQNNSKAMSYRNRAILSLACSDKRGGFSPIRVVSFLKQSYFSEQNLFLVLIDSLWVWKIYDYMRHFIFRLGIISPRVFNIIQKVYSKVIKS